MTSINRSGPGRTDSPRTDSPGTSGTSGPGGPDATSKAKGPDDIGGTSDVDDAGDVEDLGDVGQSMVADGIDRGGRGPGAVATSSSANGVQVPQQRVEASNVSGVQALVLDTIGDLEPGEGAKIGGSAEVGEAVIGAFGVSVEVERQTNGAYKVKFDETLGLGVGLKGKVGVDNAFNAGGELKGMASVAMGAEFTFASAEEASSFIATIAKEAAGGAALGGLFGTLLGPPGGAMGGAIAQGNKAALETIVENLDKASASKVEVGLGAEVELTADLELLTAKLGLNDGAKGALVYEAPDNYFLDVTMEGAMPVGGKVGVEDFSMSTGGAFQGSVRLRIPLEAPKNGATLSDPDIQYSLLAMAKAHLNDATLEATGKVTVPNTPVGVNLEAKKSVPFFEAAKLLNSDDWDTKVTMGIGIDSGVAIGPVTTKVVAQKTKVLTDPPPGNLDATIADVESRQAELAAKAKVAGG